ncbi:hypothetical protein [Streptomyces cyaneofuscatus]|uniref:hypothetical protein n=1 Tax=Streptomyces cyaneofuscatus TaxID=66883 RepID=UPI002FEF8678
MSRTLHGDRLSGHPAGQPVAGLPLPFVRGRADAELQTACPAVDGRPQRAQQAAEVVDGSAVEPGRVDDSEGVCVHGVVEHAAQHVRDHVSPPPGPDEEVLARASAVVLDPPPDEVGGLVHAVALGDAGDTRRGLRDDLVREGHDVVLQPEFPGFGDVPVPVPSALRGEALEEVLDAGDLADLQRAPDTVFTDAGRRRGVEVGGQVGDGQEG